MRRLSGCGPRRRSWQPTFPEWPPALALAASVLLFAAAPVPGRAQGAVVIYRCTDASGAVTVQNDVACPKGSRQQRRVIETAAPPPYTPPPPEPEPRVTAQTMPPPAPTVIEAPPPESPTDAPIPLVERTAPPPLFACKTWNREEYLSDNPIPAERCAPMQTTGLGGDPEMGAGAACMMVTDFCQPVPEAALCERWHDHLMRTEAIIEFDRARDPVAANAELERIRSIVARSTCTR